MTGRKGLLYMFAISPKLGDLLALDWAEFLGVRVCLRLWVGGEMVAEYEEEADREAVENPLWRYDAAFIEKAVLTRNGLYYLDFFAQ